VLGVAGNAKVPLPIYSLAELGDDIDGLPAPELAVATDQAKGFERFERSLQALPL
jgi:hypothetical protein